MGQLSTALHIMTAMASIKLSNMLCTKLSTDGDKAVGLASFSLNLPLFRGFPQDELHVCKLLTLWIRCVEKAWIEVVDASIFRMITRIRSYFRRIETEYCSTRGWQHYTGCALSYPQVWMNLCIFTQTSLNTRGTGVSAGAGAGPSLVNYKVVSY